MGAADGTRAAVDPFHPFGGPGGVLQDAPHDGIRLAGQTPGGGGLVQPWQGRRESAKNGPRLGPPGADDVHEALLGPRGLQGLGQPAATCTRRLMVPALQLQPVLDPAVPLVKLIQPERPVDPAAAVVLRRHPGKPVILPAVSRNQHAPARTARSEPAEPGARLGLIGAVAVVDQDVGGHRPGEQPRLDGLTDPPQPTEDAFANAGDLGGKPPLGADFVQEPRQCRQRSGDWIDLGGSGRPGLEYRDVEPRLAQPRRRYPTGRSGAHDDRIEPAAISDRRAIPHVCQFGNFQ